MDLNTQELKLFDKLKAALDISEDKFRNEVLKANLFVRNSLFRKLGIKVKDLNDCLEGHHCFLPHVELDNTTIIQLPTRTSHTQAKKKEQDGYKTTFTLDDQIEECYAVYFPISKIDTDVGRFQNRENEYSEESVQRIVSDYSPNKFDPVVIWIDDKDKQYYILSGHSRLEAAKRLGLDKIPARIFKGDEEEAIYFAKIEANRGGTLESFAEELKAFKIAFDRGETDAKLKQSFTQMPLTKYKAFMYLDPNGRFMDILKQGKEVQDSFYNIKNKAMWVGNIKKTYPFLTRGHEDELFNYLFKDETGNKISTMQDFVDLVLPRINNVRLYPEQPLFIHSTTSVVEKDAKRMIDEITKDIKELSKILSDDESKKKSSNVYVGLTKEQRQMYYRMIEEKQNQLMNLEGRDIPDIRKTQKGMFE